MEKIVSMKSDVPPLSPPSDTVLKETVVNPAHPSFNEGSLYNLTTDPLLCKFAGFFNYKSLTNNIAWLGPEIKRLY